MSEHARGVLDTSIVVALETYAPAQLPVIPVITAMTLAELSAGPLLTNDPAERAARQARLQEVEASFDPLPFDAAAARAFARVRLAPYVRQAAEALRFRRTDRSDRVVARASALHREPTGCARSRRTRDRVAGFTRGALSSRLVVRRKSVAISRRLAALSDRVFGSSETRRPTTFSPRPSGQASPGQRPRKAGTPPRAARPRRRRRTRASGGITRSPGPAGGAIRCPRAVDGVAGGTPSSRPSSASMSRPPSRLVSAPPSRGEGAYVAALSAPDAQLDAYRETVLPSTERQLRGPTTLSRADACPPPFRGGPP